MGTHDNHINTVIFGVDNNFVRRITDIHLHFGHYATMPQAFGQIPHFALGFINQSYLFMISTP